MIEVGSKVEGNWGAMHPIDNGEVTAINGNLVTVQWEQSSSSDLDTSDYLKSEIREPGETSINGSSIGVFVI